MRHPGPRRPELGKRPIYYHHYFQHIFTNILPMPRKLSRKRTYAEALMYVAPVTVKIISNLPPRV